MENILKKKLMKGKTVIGTWCMIPSSFVVDVIASTGVDFIIIDMEHGAMSFETAEEMARAAQVHQCQPIVRVTDSSDQMILHALEIGSNAVMVPHISTSESAKQVAQSTKYFPEGNRGLSPYTRNHKYSHFGLDKSIRWSNENVFTGILIEEMAGIENLSAIISVKGIDLVYLGIYDISQSIGFPGEVDHPEVIKKLGECVEKINLAGKFSGTFARNIKDCKFFKNLGFRFIAYAVDCFALKNFYESTLLDFS